MDGFPNFPPTHLFLSYWAGGFKWGGWAVGFTFVCVRACVRV